MTREEAKRNLIYAISWNDMPSKEALEMAVKALEQEPCEDAISRQTVLDKKELVELEDGQSFYCISPEDVETLPSVTPQPKTGHWIKGKYRYDDIRYNDNSYKCDKCGRIVDFKENYCPDCGAKMIEPQESEG